MAAGHFEKFRDSVLLIDISRNPVVIKVPGIGTLGFCVLTLFIYLFVFVNYGSCNDSATL
jgi:hypothetical protein